jgi:oxygen-independent coproporphyrinogen-3 oxidase
VYIGGGTPSCVDPKYIVETMETLKSVIRFVDNPEITIESNPGTLDTFKIKSYLNCGINRLSMGLQSADDDELKMISRIHDKSGFESSYMLARMLGFKNINVDIMYALPGQKEETLMNTIDYVTSLDPEHISFYGLRVEEGTPLASQEELLAKIPDEDVQYNMYIHAAKRLAKAGYTQYEISNFSKKRMMCRHNCRYWKSGDYIGFGPGAASFINGELYSYTKDLYGFISKPTDYFSNVEKSEKLTLDQQATQYIMLGLRLARGVEAKEYKLRFGRDLEEDYGEKIQKYIDLKYAKRTDKGFRLTRAGLLVSNTILSDILDFS